MGVAGGIALHAWASALWARRHTRVPEAFAGMLRATTGRHLYRLSGPQLERALQTYDVVADAAHEFGRIVGQLVVSRGVSLVAGLAALATAAVLSPRVALVLLLWAIPVGMLALRATSLTASNVTVERRRAWRSVEHALVARMPVFVESGQAAAAERVWLTLAETPTVMHEASTSDQVRASMTVLAVLPCLTVLSLFGVDLTIHDVIASAAGVLALHHGAQLVQQAGVLPWLETQRETVRSFLCEGDARAACGPPVGLGFDLELQGADGQPVSLRVEPGALIILLGDTGSIRELMARITWPRTDEPPMLRVSGAEPDCVPSAANGWIRTWSDDTPRLDRCDDMNLLRLARGSWVGGDPPGSHADRDRLATDLGPDVGLLLLSGVDPARRPFDSRLLERTRRNGTCVVLTGADDIDRDAADALIEVSDAGCVVHRTRGRVRIGEQTPFDERLALAPASVCEDI
ncbi:hypothetical protein [Nannocystis radixulma]|uniref:ABC transmembrane type-1 domain-containing protein n=1 Tax=Nannocystis radixulma TaxID=2995305 RepID=A0ABT5BDC9_9BACT|nr:hypothetical protein [Nannocystis radixulma]MDC0672152.1 hypothetical protein [Nannocystis radixulma]